MFKRLKEKIFADHNQVEQKEWMFYIDYLKEGMVVFDIGANIGDLTTLYSHFVRNNGKVYSFEPTPCTFDKLAKTVENTGRKNVVLNNIALSETIGELEFNLYPEEFSSWNTIVDRPLEKYGILLKPQNKVKVRSDTIDNYCKSNNIDSIDLLKIDVEGAELDVLNGAIEMFKWKKIKCCVFEYGQTIYDRGHSSKDINEFFKQINYKIENVITDDPIFPHDRKTKQALFSVHYAKPLKRL